MDPRFYRTTNRRTDEQPDTAFSHCETNGKTTRFSVIARGRIADAYTLYVRMLNSYYPPTKVVCVYVSGKEVSVIVDPVSIFWRNSCILLVNAPKVIRSFNTERDPFKKREVKLDADSTECDCTVLAYNCRPFVFSLRRCRRLLKSTGNSWGNP